MIFQSLNRKKTSSFHPETRHFCLIEAFVKFNRRHIVDSPRMKFIEQRRVRGISPFQDGNLVEVRPEPLVRKLRKILICRHSR